jgi:threonine dehydrogenase-like Zn-dependent dehydrogenase
VEWVGPKVSGLKKGQTVFATITTTIGTHLGFGGHLVEGPSHQNEVFALPDTPDPVAYSGLVLTQVGYNCGWRTPGKGAFSVVVGDGMVGLWAAQTLKARGSRVALMGKHAERMKIYKPADGDILVRGDQPDWADKLREWCGGNLDTVVDSVGYDVNKAQNEQLQQMLKRDGHFVEAGHVGANNLIDIRALIMKETTLHTPCGWTRERLQTTLEWIHDGRLETLPLITHRLPAKEAAKAWDIIFNKKEGALGVVLEWPQ